MIQTPTHNNTAAPLPTELPGAPLTSTLTLSYSRAANIGVVVSLATVDNNNNTVAKWAERVGVPLLRLRTFVAASAWLTTVLEEFLFRRQAVDVAFVVQRDSDAEHLIGFDSRIT